MARVLENPKVSEFGDRVSQGPFELLIMQGDYLMSVEEELYRAELKYRQFDNVVVLVATWSDPPVSVAFQLSNDQYDHITRGI